MQLHPRAEQPSGGQRNLGSDLLQPSRNHKPSRIQEPVQAANSPGQMKKQLVDIYILCHPIGLYPESSQQTYNRTVYRKHSPEDICNRLAFNNMGNENTCQNFCQGFIYDLPRDRFRNQVGKNKRLLQRAGHHSDITGDALFELMKKQVQEEYRETLPTVKFRSGCEYEGQWVYGDRDGKGRQTFPNGSVYEGEWRHNQMSGKGKLTYADGDTFEGQWSNSKAHGFGIYSHHNGAMHEGYWADNQQNGQGVEQWPDGSKYEGEFKDGKKHGQGTYLWPDGSYYTGAWEENQLSGYGQYLWISGRSYKGEWLKNKMHGKGVHIWQDGRRYEGQYYNDKKHGIGKYIWPDGKVFKGQWVNGKREGKGKYYGKGGVIQEGVWKNDRRVNPEGQESNIQHPIEIQVNNVPLPNKPARSSKIFGK